MLKKVIIIVGSLLFLVYASYVGYEYYNNNKSLNSLIKIKVSLEGNYNASNKNIDTLNKTIEDIKVEKEEIKTQIAEREESLAQVNNQITVKQAAILAEQQRRREAETKLQISTGSGNKVAYLTFDDGPSSYTSKVLDILQEYGVKATFFVNGRSDNYSLNMYRRIVNEGHSIGNHTYSHRFANIYKSVSAFDDDFNNLQYLIYNTTGVTMDIMRFPGGSNNTTSNNYNYGIMDTLTVKYKNLGYKYFDWNSSAGDTGAGATTTSVINKITNECRYKNFVIILMHDSMWTTPNALPTVIQNLTGLGFRFEKLSHTTTTIQFK